MDNKKIGISVILVGALFIAVIILFKMQITELADFLMKTSSGSCFLEDGSCIHERSDFPFIAGMSLAVITIGFGAYLVFFSRAAKSFETINKKILSEVKAEKSKGLEEEKFRILMQGLGEEEKKIITSVKEQDGISQSTLKYRTDLSKTKLSIVLSQLEKKGLIAKVKKGKINNIYLKKAL